MKPDHILINLEATECQVFHIFFLIFSFIICINSIKEYKILKAGETTCQLIEVEIESINHFPSKANSTFRIEI